MTNTPAIISYAKYRIEPRNADAFRALAICMADETTSNERALFLDVLQDVRDPNDLSTRGGLAGSGHARTARANPAFCAMLAEARQLRS